jgi:hypothetical protein
VELRKQDTSRTRTIYPLPELDPNFSVELRKLTSAQVNAIYDRHGYNERHGRTMAKLEKVLRDVVKASVVRVNGATQNGVPLDPEADETKLLLLEVPVEVDGEQKVLWDVVTALAAEEERAEQKNTLRP